MGWAPGGVMEIQYHTVLGMGAKPPWQKAYGGSKGGNNGKGFDVEIARHFIGPPSV